jgi:hypothetical protein
MAKTDYKTINEYHEAFTGDILERLQTVRELVHKVAPEAQEVYDKNFKAVSLWIREKLSKY